MSKNIKAFVSKPPDHEYRYMKFGFFLGNEDEKPVKLEFIKDKKDGYYVYIHKDGSEHTFPTSSVVKKSKYAELIASRYNSSPFREGTIVETQRGIEKIIAFTIKANGIFYTLSNGNGRTTTILHDELEEKIRKSKMSNSSYGWERIQIKEFDGNAFMQDPNKVEVKKLKNTKSSWASASVTMEDPFSVNGEEF